MRFDLVGDVLQGLKSRVFVEGGCQFWFARDLMELAGAGDWLEMLSWLRNAKLLCSSGEEPVFRHFRDVGRIIFEAGGRPACIEDVQLTGYACYLAGVAGAATSSRAALIALHMYASCQQQCQVIFAPLPDTGAVLALTA